MTSFFKEHIVGMLLFAIITGIIATYTYDKIFKSSPPNLIEIGSIESKERFEGVTAIVNVMVKEGQIDGSCVQKQAQKWEILDVALFDLNDDGIKEYLISGNAPCASGARMPLCWVYAKTNNEHRRLLNAGALDNLYVSDHRTNGFRDLVTKITTGAGTETFLTTLKYDGKEYRESK
jgi:hypothetical protein